MHAKKKVLLVGQYPPPIGGVTIHLKRFFDKYKESEEISIALWDIKKKKYYENNIQSPIWASLRKIISVDIVHMHLSSNIKIVLAVFYKILGKKVVYTHHNIRINNMMLFKILMLFVDKLILVNDRDISKNIKKYQYDVIPAFLPAYESTDLPEALTNKIEKYSTVISTNCSHLTYINEKDLYGFDLCVEALTILEKTQKIENTLLLLVDPSGTAKEYVQKLLQNFESQYNCDIVYIDDMLDFNTLICASTMILRATRSDGDALTIREALYLNVPIIASNITWRPEGTILFEHENSRDLSRKICDVVKGNIVTSKYENVDNGKKVIEIYRSMR